MALGQRTWSSVRNVFVPRNKHTHLLQA